MKKKKVRKLEKEGFIFELEKKRGRTVSQTDSRRQHRSPRRKSEPRRVTRPKSRTTGKLNDDIIESGEDVNQVRPQKRKEKGICEGPHCRNPVGRDGVAKLCRSCMEVLEKHRKEKKEEMKRVRDREASTRRVQQQQQHQLQLQQPPQYHHCGCHTQRYEPRPSPVPRHCTCNECQPQYRPPRISYRQPPCYCSRCVQADDAGDEESPLSSVSDDLGSMVNYNHSDSGFETTEPTDRFCKTPRCRGIPEEKKGGLCRDCSQHRLSCQ